MSINLEDLNLIIIPKSKCACVNVAMGSYDNQIMLGYYPVMQGYMKRRKEAGLSEVGICIDRCLVDEIVMLWKADIMTFGCCCGHDNYNASMVNIKHFDIDKLTELGYDIFNINPEIPVTMYDPEPIAKAI